MLSDLNKNKEIMDLLSKNLTKKDFKKVMDFIYNISINSDFYYTQQLYQKLVDTYYQTDNKKENIVKFKVVKGGHSDDK